MPVQTVDQCLYGRLVQMTEVRSCLSGLMAHHQRGRSDEAESIYDDLALDGLNRINDDGDSSRRKLFEGLLRVDVD